MQGPIAAVEFLGQKFQQVGGAIQDMTVGQASKLEDFTAAFTPLTGSAENAKAMIRALNREAATTPFELTGIATVAKQLLPVLGNNVKDVTKTFRMLGDTAGGDIQKLDSITRGYVKVMNTGKVSMEALNMISDAGVPIYNQLASSMGISVAEMTNLSSQGKITDKDLTKAFENMTSEGGIFFKGMEVSSLTLTGKVSSMNDALSQAGAVIGMQLLPTQKDLADQVTGLANDFTAWASTGDNLKNTMRLVGETAVIAAIGLGTFLVVTQGAAVVRSFAAAMVALNAAMAANPIGLIAIGVTALLIGINAVVEAIGGWQVAWLYVQRAALMVVDGLGTMISGLVNSVIDTLNTVIGAYNTVVTTLGGKPIKLFAHEDISASLGIKKALQDVNDQIVATDRAATEAAVKRTAERRNAEAAAQRALAHLGDEKEGIVQIASVEAEKNAAALEAASSQRELQDQVLSKLRAQTGTYAEEQAAAKEINDEAARRKTGEAIVEGYMRAQVAQQQLGLALEQKAADAEAERVELNKKIVEWADKANAAAQVLSHLLKKMGKEDAAALVDSLAQAGTAIANLVKSNGADIGAWASLGIASIDLIGQAWDSMWGNQTKAQKAASEEAKKAEDARLAAVRELEGEYQAKFENDLTRLARERDERVAYARSIGADVLNIERYYAGEIAKVKVKSSGTIDEEQTAARWSARINKRYEGMIATVRAKEIQLRDLLSAAQKDRQEAIDKGNQAWLMADKIYWKTKENQAQASIDTYTGLVNAEVAATAGALQTLTDAQTAELGKVEENLRLYQERFSQTFDGISSALTQGLKDGTSRKDFRNSIMSMLRDMAIDAAILAGGFAEQFKSIGKMVAKAMKDGFSAEELAAIRGRVTNLYKRAQSSVSGINDIFASVGLEIPGYAVGTLKVGGDQLAMVHDSEMILPAGISDQARNAGLYIGPSAGLAPGGSLGGIVKPSYVIKPTTIEVDGRTLGRVAFEFVDENVGLYA